MEKKKLTLFCFLCLTCGVYIAFNPWGHFLSLRNTLKTVRWGSLRNITNFLSFLPDNNTAGTQEEAFSLHPSTTLPPTTILMMKPTSKTTKSQTKAMASTTKAKKPTTITRKPTTMTRKSTSTTMTTKFGKFPTNLTIVTAYWNLGTFKKGYGNTYFSTNTYFNWASTFKYLVNPLVVYTDSEKFKVLMETLRADNLHNTKIFLMNRTVFWPFQLTDQIKSVYDQPGYPKHPPNTVNPGYAAAQHSKFAVVADTVRKKFFDTPYYAWLDVGYFRDIVKLKDFFKIDTPPGFNSQRVSFNKPIHQHMNTDPFNIFRNNIVWVGGGMFIASGEIILQFEQLYHKAVLYFLKQKLMNSDQQVVYSMYTEKGRKALNPKVELQLFIPKGSGNPWFYLGYLCRKVVSVNKS